jgi:hypothetical protein
VKGELMKKINVDNMQPNILYYSRQCLHSSRFREMLVKKPDLESTFIKLCVDGGGKLPPYVRSVPFIVVHDSQGAQLRLTDSNAFQWLNQQMEQLAGDFEAYDGGVMSSSLSDCYSFLSDEGSTVKAPVGHTFEWINDAEKPFNGTFSGMNTPDEKTFGGGTDRLPKSDIDKLIESRNQDLPKLQRPDEIDFRVPLNQQQHQRAPAAYAQSARQKEVRIPAPRQGVDFQSPRFQTGQPMMPRSGPVKSGPIKSGPVNQSIHRAQPPKQRQAGINGRALPAGWNRMR